MLSPSCLLYEYQAALLHKSMQTQDNADLKIGRVFAQQKSADMIRTFL